LAQTRQVQAQGEGLPGALAGTMSHRLPPGIAGAVQDEESRANEEDGFAMQDMSPEATLVQTRTHNDACSRIAGTLALLPLAFGVTFLLLSAFAYCAPLATARVQVDSHAMETLSTPAITAQLRRIADQGSPIVSNFGNRPLCTSQFVRDAFTESAIQAAEQDLSNWFLHLDEVIETYVDHIADRPHDRIFSNILKDRQHSFYRTAMPPVGPMCREPIQWFGQPSADVSKPYCRAANIFDNGCDLFSLGSNSQWSTEIAMHKTTPCRIHTFDCTSKDSMPAAIRDRTTFYQICVSDTDRTTKSGRQFLSWPSLLKLTKVTAQPSFLKMDVGGFEYGVMRSILRSDASQFFPQQIAMEIHTEIGDNAGPVRWADRKKSGGELLAFMLMLYESGYRLTMVNWETECPHCIAVLFARIYC